jgi:hypothetical protein
MNKLMMALAALGLASSATAAYAEEPTKVSDVYFYIGHTTEAIALVGDSVVTHGPGEKKDVWVLLFQKTPETIEGHTVQGAWVLTEIDCDANTMQIVRIEPVMDGETKTLPGAAAEPIKDGTPGDATADLVCRGDASGVKRIESADVVPLLKAYRAAE